MDKDLWEVGVWRAGLVECCQVLTLRPAPAFSLRCSGYFCYKPYILLVSLHMILDGRRSPENLALSGSALRPAPTAGLLTPVYFRCVDPEKRGEALPLKDQRQQKTPTEILPELLHP